MKYRVVVFHRAIFSSIGDDLTLMKYLVPIIETYNVSLCLYGHMHEYERFYYHNHTYICLGGGGGTQALLRKNQSFTQAMAMGASFTQLFFNETGILIRTLSPTYDVMDEVFLRDYNGGLIPENLLGGA